MWIMAFSALTDTVMGGRIRIMTLSTSWDHPGFCGGMICMAIAALNIVSMRTTRSCQILYLSSMACRTLAYRGSVTPAVVCGLVRSMTSYTVGIDHFGAMRLVAIRTFEKLTRIRSMLQVAIRTRHMGMRAGNFIKLPPDIMVARKTYVRNIIIYHRE
jgi:hypothetical protein